MNAAERPVTEVSVTVVIPTTARRERASLLRRAIASVREQQGIHARALVVVNGPHRAPEVENELRGDPDIQVLVLAEGSLPGALRAGRALVETRWFATLDDDDFLLPDALITRARVLEANPDVDVVVTNGIFRTDGTDIVNIDPNLNVGADPLHALLQRN